MLEKPQILFVTSRLPAPGIYGDQLRSWRFLLTMAERFEITMVCLDDGRNSDLSLQHVRQQVKSLILVPHSRVKSVAGALSFLAMGKAAQVGWFHSRQLATELEKLVATGEFKGAFLQLARLHSAIPALDPLPVVLDFVDALSMQWMRRGSSGSPVHRVFNRLEAKRMTKCELDILHRCHATFATSGDDAQHLESLSELAIDVNIIPNGVDMELFKPLPKKTENGEDAAKSSAPVTLFSGNLDYLPNRDAVVYFAEEVLPILRREHPDLRFIAAGKITSKDLRPLAETHGVEFTGFVEDLGAEIASADVVVTPMVNGAGIQNKVLEAMSTGTPVVATRLANAGIKAAHGREILIGGSPETLAKHVLKLIECPRTASQIGNAGREFVRNKFSWDAQGTVVADHLEDAVSRPTRPRPLVSSLKSQNAFPPLGTRFRKLKIALARAEELIFLTFTRLLHLVVSLTILSGFALVLPLIALVIKTDSPGPIFYSQQRVGINRRRTSANGYAGPDRRSLNQGGKLFTIWKLRSMRQDAEDGSGPVWAKKQDNRITKTGGILRKSRLDEIPQLWNVLNGDMSLVGPRPERPLFVNELNQVYPGYRMRLSGFKPGITGLAQVQGTYDTDIEMVGEKLILDHGYRLKAKGARNHFMTDLKVILQTVPTVITGKGAH